MLQRHFYTAGLAVYITLGHEEFRFAKLPAFENLSEKQCPVILSACWPRQVKFCLLVNGASRRRAGPGNRFSLVATKAAHPFGQQSRLFVLPGQRTSGPIFRPRRACVIQCIQASLFLSAVRLAAELRSTGQK
jgi:hypothetical protein